MNTTTRPAQATEILKAEHEVILDVLDALEKVTGDARRTRRLDLRSAREILDFLGTFADRCHHGKEEGALFPTLARKGLPLAVGPLAVMLSEHERGRAEVAGMRAAMARCELDDPRALDAFADHAVAYVELLRDHIAKENNVLFPMADGMLDEADRAALLRAFEAHEREDLGEGTHEQYLALVGALLERLGIVPSPRSSARAGGCCGGHSTCHAP